MKLHVKSASFSTDNSRHQDCPFFTVFLTIKTLSQNISITLLQISIKLHEHRGCYCRKKLRWMIFEEQFPVPRYTAASKIGNSVISLLWQLRCRCNPDHNKFSSLSNTTVVAIFPNLCLWRRSSCSNLGGIDREKLYRATLKAVLSKFSLALQLVSSICGSFFYIIEYNQYCISIFLCKSNVKSTQYRQQLGNTFLQTSLSSPLQRKKCFFFWILLTLLSHSVVNWGILSIGLQLSKG